MFPSWDSLSELENYQALLRAIALWGAIIFGILAVIIGGWWAWYNNKLDDRIDELRKARDDAKEAAIQADVAEAKKLIPETTGIIRPGNGATPPLPKYETPAWNFSPLPDGIPDETRKLIEDSQRRAEQEHKERTERFEQENKFPDDAFLFFVGNNVCWTPDFPLSVVAQGDEDILWIEKEGDGIVVSAKFFNSDGKIICEIVKSTFHLNPKNYFRMERKPNRLTVINDELKRIIDIEYINKRCIRLFGEFYGRAGATVYDHPGAH